MTSTAKGSVSNSGMTRQIYTPVSAVDLFLSSIGSQRLERVLDLGQQVALVLLGRQDIVGLFSNELLGDRPLASHRIDGHHGSAQLQLRQKLGNGRNLVGLVVDFALRQHPVVGADPGRNHMHQRCFACLTRAAQRLAVDGHHLARSQLGNRRHPGRKPLLQFNRIKPGVDAVERIVRRSASR